METWYLYLIYVFASVAIVGLCLNALSICCMPMIRLTTKQQDNPGQNCRNIVVLQHQDEHINNIRPDVATITYITLEVPPPKYEDAVRIPFERYPVRM